MGDIVAGRPVDWLKEYAASETYEEDCQPRQPWSPMNVLVHERGPFSLLLDPDAFEDLRTAMPPDHTGNGSTSGTGGTGNNCGTMTGNDGETATGNNGNSPTANDDEKAMGNNSNSATCNGDGTNDGGSGDGGYESSNMEVDGTGGA